MADSKAKSLTNFENIRDTIKASSQSIMDASTSRSIFSSRFFSYTRQIYLALVSFNEIKLIPGMGQYAKDQYEDQALNMGARFTTMTVAMEVVVAWPLTGYPDMIGNVPQGGTYINGEVTDRLLTTAELADFRVQVQSLITALI